MPDSSADCRLPQLWRSWRNWRPCCRRVKPDGLSRLRRRAGPEPVPQTRVVARNVGLTYNTVVSGDVAQLGERRTRTAEVVGSTPIVSTRKSLIDGGFVRPHRWRAASERPKWYSMVLCGSEKELGRGC